MDQFGLLTLDGSTTYRSNVSGSHRSLNVAPPLFIGGVSDAVSLAPQALTVQGELDITPHIWSAITAVCLSRQCRCGPPHTETHPQVQHHELSVLCI